MARGPIPDKPTDRPSVAEVQRLIDAYYQFDGCIVGGDLHVVLDDGNWEDGSIQWCIDTAGTREASEPECARLLGRLLLLTTRTQRNGLRSGYSGQRMSSSEFIAMASAILARCQ